MIRRLTQHNRDLVRAYLGRDPLHNVYMIHGLQTHGLESEHATFWGAFAGSCLEGILFTDDDYKHRFGSLASDDPKVLSRLGRLALRSGVRTLAGKSSCIGPAIETLPSRVRYTNMEHLDFYSVDPRGLAGPCDYPVQRATREGLPLLVELYRDYELTGNKTESETAREIQRAMDKGASYFFIERDGRAVSGARIFPRTDLAGMIDGARTLPEFRGRGLYTCVRTAMLKHLASSGRIGIGLVNEANEPVHKIVSRQGGNFTDKWLIVAFTRRPSLWHRILAGLRRLVSDLGFRNSNSHRAGKA